MQPVHPRRALYARCRRRGVCIGSTV